MTFHSQITRSGDTFAELVEALKLEFGSRDVGALAASIVEAERADFHWDARVRERYLGQYHETDFGDLDGPEELDRIAILSDFGGRFHAGVCLVDGEGNASDMLWLRSFDHEEDALDTYARAH